MKRPSTLETIILEGSIEGLQMSFVKAGRLALYADKGSVQEATRPGSDFQRI